MDSLQSRMLELMEFCEGFFYQMHQSSYSWESYEEEDSFPLAGQDFLE